jgi:hypothetical protein
MIIVQAGRGRDSIYIADEPGAAAGDSSRMEGAGSEIIAASI